MLISDNRLVREVESAMTDIGDEERVKQGFEAKGLEDEFQSWGLSEGRWRELWP